MRSSAIVVWAASTLVLLAVGRPPTVARLLPGAMPPSPTSLVSGGHTRVHESLRAIRAMAWWSPTIGFLATSQGVFRTLNGGNTWALWSPAVGGDQGAFDSLQAVGPNLLWATTMTQLYRINDGVPHVVYRGKRSPSLYPRPASLATVSRAKTFWLEDGTIYRVEVGTPARVRSASPPGPVRSMVWFGAVGFAATGPSVWITTDGGFQWRRVFTAPVSEAAGRWGPDLAANSPRSVWDVMSGEGGLGHYAYILFHTPNGGRTWQPMVDEAYMQSTGYPTVRKTVLPSTLAPGGIPGPITAVGAEGALFFAWNDSPDLKALRIIETHGTLLSLPSSRRPGAPQFGRSPVVQFSSPSTGWIAGGTTDGEAALLVTHNGGRTWRIWPIRVKAATRPTRSSHSSSPTGIRGASDGRQER